VKKTQTLTPVEAMKLAIEEARKGAGFVAPNPMVGCVILDEKFRLLSTGYHKKYGGAHAEVEALKGVSDEHLEGAHIFVTLEPCAHDGKTPSCAKHLAELPIASLTYGVQDPNPLTNGAGAKILRKAGIEVREFDQLKPELEELAEVFLQNMRNKRPFVSLKVATSLDGQMALKNGQSKWITNELSREHVHFLRATHDAVLVGRNTIEIDNPMLNVRHPKFKGKKNKVVILDSEAQLASKLSKTNLAKVHDAEDIYLVTKPGIKITDSVGYIQIECPMIEGGMFDIDKLLIELYAKGIGSVMVEGGALTYRSFFLQKQIQRVVHFQAPVLLGSENGIPWTQGLFIPDMENRIVLRDVRAQFFGGDLMTSARLA
jgi:diaminohydroxyphosphoribosylaminopyrimidine deaminase/5-amino-6-(5-phosphoribosylamino)uracil reductase